MAPTNVLLENVLAFKFILILKCYRQMKHLFWSAKELMITYTNINAVRNSVGCNSKKSP